MTESENLVRDVVTGELRYRTRFELEAREQKVRDRVFAWVFLGSCAVGVVVVVGFGLAIYGGTQ